MFFKMLKSDLKQKKGLSIVLFLFILIASVLVSVGSVQLYEFFTGNERNQAACNNSDAIVLNVSQGAQGDSANKKVSDVIKKNKHVKESYSKEVFTLLPAYIDFDYVDEEKTNEFRYSDNYLTTVPKDHDLVYTLDDQPFGVENNTIWVSEKVRSVTGAAPGDKVRLTTDIGNTYEFTLAGFYKQSTSSNFKWYIVSDPDYEYLKKEYFNTTEVFGVKFDEMNYMNYKSLDDDLGKDTNAWSVMLDAESSDEYVLSYILSVFICLVGIFLILIVVMTIRFTMVAALKEEEREIGVLRAIGADSSGFRWIFAAKYIAFALTGGAVGIFAGIPLSKYVLTAFSPGKIMPSDGEIIIIGIISVIFIILLIIVFSLLVMRRINRISVVDAIRGENRAERFSKGSGIRLHTKKKMSPSFFIALSDILKRFKRYAFLFIAYTLGVLIILFIVNIKNSVINPEFLKYNMVYETDFFVEFNDTQLHEYFDRMANEDRGLWSIVNDDLKKNGIKAHFDADHYQTTGVMQQFGADINATVWNGSGDISKLSYHEGSIPVKEDEAAISWSAANSLGIQLGDEVEIKLNINNNNTGSTKETKEKFRITAFINAMDGGVPIVVLSNAYNKTFTNEGSCWASVIDAQGSEKDEVFSQLQEFYGPECVLDEMEYTRMTLMQYSELFDLLEVVIGLAVLVILILMTYLYSSVFIAEEMSEIALLKSIGFSERAVKASHIFRILILAVVSVIAAELLLQTAGQLIVSIIMESLGISNFRLLPEFIMSFAVVPVLASAAVLFTEWLNLRKIRKADIRNIKDE